MNAVHQAALAAHDAGMCVLPPREDGSKAPDADSWTGYQTTRSTREEIEAWYASGQRSGVGLVLGAVSGNAEVLDFDELPIYLAFKELAEEVGLGPLVERIEAGYLEETPNHGRHWLYRCDEIDGNTKLASRPTRPEERAHELDTIKTLIETRGQGGYVVTAPSNGQVHPNGGAYRLLSGSVSTIAAISPEERAELFSVARSLDAMPKVPSRDLRSEATGGSQPGSDYNERGDALAVLEAYGWRVISERNGTMYLRRPGKDHGVSATFGHAGTRYFYPFTSSTIFEPNRAFSPFAVYALLEHRGDFAAAARALAAQGYGASQPNAGEESDVMAPYATTPNGIVYRKPMARILVDQLLCNFDARIVEEVIADDGASKRSELAIEGTLADGTPLPRIRVPMRRYPSLDWVYEWGTRPRIGAGFGTKDRLREAIQYLSPQPARRYIYEHPGWCHLPEHGWCYLHAGGAIGAAGTITDVDVVLHGAASHIRLPDPPSRDELRAAVLTCLSLLDLAPDHLTVPLFGAVFRAPLSELVPADTSVFAVGPTGVFKTELSALAMQHFGASFDRLHLPAHWSATDNFLERAAFDFKDAPLVVDDFAPGGAPTDIARLHAKADRLLRGAGNRGSRGRMWSDGSQRPDVPPRGIIIGTGEDAPRGQSLRSRVMLLDVAPGDVDRERLRQAQAAARAGTFAAGMAGFVQSLAPQFEDLRESLPGLLADYRTQAHAGAAHARTPDAVAHLAVGWWAFLRFAVAVGAMTQAEAEQMFARVWAALGEAAARQAGYQAVEEPARRFLELLSSALAAGHVHFASPEGGVPRVSPEAWGWRFERISAGEYERHEWRPQGNRAGWIDGDDLYLDLEAALAGVHRISQASGSGVTVTPKTLAKRLHERGFLRSTEQHRGSLKVRHALEGRRRNVLHLAQSALTLEESAQSTQSAQRDAKGAQPRYQSTENGLFSWEDLPPVTT
jgi:hypothetical protein